MFALAVALASVPALAGGGCARRDAGTADATASDAHLTFVRNGTVTGTFDLAALERFATVETASMLDPYYRKPKRFRVMRLAPILRGAFGDPRTLEHEQFVLRARDGYTVPITGARLLEPGAALAFADLDVPSWEPVGPQRADPGPFYLVWLGSEQQDLEAHPRPWQLASIEIAPFASVFPHTSPGDVPPESPAAHGYAIFREECIRCHAINREGGHVGPELNVPQSIVEYRPEAQIRAYIRNPFTFRYGNMPAHPGLTDANLDELVAYFRAMSVRKHDTGAPP